MVESGLRSKLARALGLAICLVFVTSGCATRKSLKEEQNAAQSGVATTVIGPNGEEIAAPSPVEVDQQISQSGFEKEFGGIPFEVKPAVVQWLRYFQGRGRVHMERYLERSTRYMDLMKGILRQNRLPEDLIYIVLIESGFSYAAYSHASAVGYWQFIKPTGKRYGLKVDTYIDERRDPVLATHSASRYLADLYEMFDDWYLAMAAYNSGENRVLRVIRKAQSKDFWVLAKRKLLPAETRNYVPKFIAAALIAKNPQAYGFDDLEYSPVLTYEELTLERSISLHKLAQALNYDYEEIRRLNPIYRSDFVPVKKPGEVRLRVPKGYLAQAKSAVEISIATGPMYAPPPEYVIHRVRRGETLSHIATKYRMSVTRVASMNGLRRGALLRVGQRIKIPDRGYSEFKTVSEPQNAEAAKGVGEKAIHTVKPGENLSLIARKYGVTLTELFVFNDFKKGASLRVGQEVRVRAEEIKKISSQRKEKSVAKTQTGKVAKAEKLAKDSGRAPTAAKKFHVVKNGDTLSEIAERYRVNLRELVQRNSLKDGSTLFVGKRIVIP